MWPLLPCCSQPRAGGSLKQTALLQTVMRGENRGVLRPWVLVDELIHQLNKEKGENSKQREQQRKRCRRRDPDFLRKAKNP